jgi:osmoprotectant transport system permease protein
VSGILSWLEYVVDQYDDILALTWEHAVLVLQAVVIATVLSILLGVLAYRIRALRGPVLGSVSILLTIPSLALFTIFIPVVGLGKTPSLIALVLYALLPIVRNTLTGLEGVERAVIESARGTGLSKNQVLLRIELPLAWPVIATGIRVSLLLTTGIAAIATLVGGGGLGDFIKDGLQDYPLAKSVERIWTGTIFTILLGLALDLAFGVLRWFTTYPQPTKPLTTRIFETRHIEAFAVKLDAAWQDVRSRTSAGTRPAEAVRAVAPGLRESAGKLSDGGFTYLMHGVVEDARAPADETAATEWNGLLDELLSPSSREAEREASPA